MIKLLLAAVAAALLSFACSGPAHAKVEVTQAPSPALARGAIFAWAPIPAQAYGIPDPAVANEITAERLQSVTEATLAAKGYRQVADPAQADLLVSYTIVMAPETDLELSAFGGSCHAFCNGPDNVNLDTRRYTRGTLVLDLTERSTGRLVLRAISDKRVKAKDATTEKLTAVLNQMTKSLPQ